MSELDEQIANRRQKRADLAARGVEAFPARCDFDLEPAGVQAAFGGRSAEELAAAKSRLRVPGRIRAIREQGKLVFVDLHDGAAKLQLFIRRNLLDAASNELLDALDLGDYLLAEGELLRTRVGELSIAPDRLTLLAKALRPLPEKWHGLADTEIRYRQRYLDLVANPESRRVFEIRAGIVCGMRAFFDRHGFLEVETPMMQAVPGGASARPFVTHHNALDIDLYLRIAPELYLKRLLVGGMHRVYEINRNFRNEGLSTQHNPEFTMLEFYWAYSNYEHLMDVTEELLVELAERILGTKKLLYKGKELDLTPPVAQAEHGGGALEVRRPVGRAETATAEGLLAAFRARGLEAPKAALGAGGANYGLLLSALFEELCEEHLDQPVFIIDHPVEISPLVEAEALGSPLHRALRALHRRHGDRERLLGAQRSGRPGGALPAAARGARGRRWRGPPLRRRLRAGARARHAAGRRRGHRHRPPDDDLRRPRVDPRRHPLSAAAPGAPRAADADADDGGIGDPVGAK